MECSTYIRLYNLFERCKRCKESYCFANVLAVARKLPDKEFAKTLVEVVKQKSKCRLTFDDFKFLQYCDFLQLFEENYEPDVKAVDHFPQDITAETDENGTWTKITLTSLV